MSVARWVRTAAKAAAKAGPGAGTKTRQRMDRFTDAARTTRWAPARGEEAAAITVSRERLFLAEVKKRNGGLAAEELDATLALFSRWLDARPTAATLGDGIIPPLLPLLERATMCGGSL